MRRVRLAVVLSSAMAAASLAASPLAGLAASPPPGVSLDGVVNVIVREAAGPGRTAGRPIENAIVTLHVSLRDAPDDELQSMTDTTEADGIATFAGVAGPEPGGPRINLDVTAHADSVDVEGGCPVARSWDGATHDTSSGGTDELVVEVTPSSSIVCPKAVLTGSVRNPAGHAVAVGRATATIAVRGASAATLRVHVAKDGAFTVDLPARGTKQAPATLTVAVVGATTRRQQLRGGCTQVLGERGVATRRVTLADSRTLPRLDVVTHEFVVAKRCPAVRPSPTSHGPSQTPRGGGKGSPLPPTDTIATGAGGRRATPPAIATDLVIAALAGAAGALAADRRGHRRRS